MLEKERTSAKNDSLEAISVSKSKKGTRWTRIRSSAISAPTTGYLANKCHVWYGFLSSCGPFFTRNDQKRTARPLHFWEVRVIYGCFFFRCSIWHRGATAEIRMYRSVLASRKQSHHWSSRWTPNMCQLSRKRCLAQMIVVVSLSPHRPQYYLLKRKQFSEEKLSQMAWRTGLLSQRSTWKAVSAVNESDCARFICFAVDWKTIL